jgi:hypothetical protein
MHPAPAGSNASISDASLGCAPVARQSSRLKSGVHSEGCPRRSDPMSARSSASSSRGTKRCWGGLNRGRSWRQENRSASQKRRQPRLTFSISLIPGRTSPPVGFSRARKWRPATGAGREGVSLRGKGRLRHPRASFRLRARPLRLFHRVIQGPARGTEHFGARLRGFKT